LKAVYTTPQLALFWLKNGSPSEFIEPDTAEVVFERLTDIRDGILRQRMDVSPTKLVAFVRFVIHWFTLPRTDINEEVDPFIVLPAVHHAGKLDVLLEDTDTDLFSRFTDGGSHYGFASIQVASGQAVFSVAITRVEAAQEQNPIPTQENEMHCNWELDAH
jgi:hypothetical protein